MFVSVRGMIEVGVAISSEFHCTCGIAIRANTGCTHQSDETTVPYRSERGDPPVNRTKDGREEVGEMLKSELSCEGDGNHRNCWGERFVNREYEFE